MGGLLDRFGFLVVLALITAGCTAEKKKMEDAGRAKGRILTVDSSGDTGHHVSLALDSKDKAHLVFYDQKNQALRYVRHSEAGFSMETVDESCKRCLFATIRVAGDFEPHIAYYSDLNQTLVYAFRRDGKWKHESIEWGQMTGMGVRLMFDDTRRLHALYYSGDGFLKHAFRVLNKEYGKQVSPATGAGKKGEKPKFEQPEGLWNSQRVDKANGSEKVAISFICQPNGRLATSYFHWSGLSSELRVAFQGEDGSWATELVTKEHNPGKSSALFFNRDGTPQVLFREALKDRLSIATQTPQGWKSEPMIASAYNMGFDVDGSFNLLIAYERMTGRDPRKGHLRMAWRSEWNWSDFEVDSIAGSGSYLSAELTTSGRPVIAYFQEKTKSLKLFIGE